MRITRREFLKLAAAIGGVSAVTFSNLEKVLAASSAAKVIWLQGQSCSGCSVSLLNSVNLTTVDDLLLNTINMEYHPTLIAAAGDIALSENTGQSPSPTQLSDFSDQWLGDSSDYDLNNDSKVNFIDFAALARQGYVLVVEGAIPTASDGKYCDIGANMTMFEAFEHFASRATHVIAIGTCACFGGIPAAAPNPTGAISVQAALDQLQSTKPLINIPGCPSHPDWFVGTVIDLLTGQAVALDGDKRPTKYFGSRVHSNCSLRGAQSQKAAQLGDEGCLENLGCKGKYTYANCPILKWNSPSQASAGVNWCVQARTPCHGCTESNFPDGMSPFYHLT